MQVSIEKPGTPHELVHYGAKGMHWGIRKAEDTATGTIAVSKKVGKAGKTTVSGVSKTASSIRKQTDISKMSKKKKIAIGVGAVALVAGTAFVAYKLNQSGKISLPKQYRSSAHIDQILEKHGSVKLSKKERTRQFWNTPTRKMSKEVSDLLSQTLNEKTAKAILGPITSKATLQESHSKKTSLLERNSKKILDTGAKQVQHLLSEHGSSQLSDLSPAITRAGKHSYQSLYVRWVNIQMRPITNTALNTVLDFSK